MATAPMRSLGTSSDFVVSPSWAVLTPERPCASGPLLTDDQENYVYLTLRSGTRLVFGVPGGEPKWFYPTLACFKKLSALADGWDSYGAHAISDRAIEVAAETLVQLDLPLQVPGPSVVPGSTGSVQLEWHRAGVDIELHVTPEGGVTGYLADGNDEIEFDSLSGAAIERLAQAWSRMAS